MIIPKSFIKGVDKGIQTGLIRGITSRDPNYSELPPEDYDYVVFNGEKVVFNSKDLIYKRSN